MSQFATSKSNDGKFVVKNLSTKVLTIFGVSIGPGRQYNLLSIRGIGEDDIKSSISNGLLRDKLDRKQIAIMQSTILFSTANAAVNALLVNNGLSNNIIASDNTSVNTPTWYIDPVAGNDSNNGTSAGTALKTHAEFEHRIGHWSKLNSPLNATILVNILNDLPASDPINVLAIAGTGITLFYAGATTVERAGSFTSVVAKNAGTNTLFQGADGYLAAADWSGDVGKRVRMTSGAAAGCSALVVAVGGASKSAIFSDFSLPLVQYLIAYPAGTPSVGDTYVVEKQVKAARGAVRFQPTNSTGGFVMFQGLDLSNNNENLIESTPYLAYFDCHLPGMIIANVDYGAFLNCYNTSLFTCNAGTGVIVMGGLYTGTVPLEGGASWTWDADALIYAKDASQLLVVEPGTDWLCGTMAIFHSHAGLQVQSNASFTIAPQLLGGANLWGASNDGYGVNVDAAGAFLYNPATTFTVTGAAGDFLLGGSNSVRPFNNATGAYVAPVACSWANLAVAVPSGFGGDAMNPTNRALIAVKHTH
jgi:hypothetical protein